MSTSSPAGATSWRAPTGAYALLETEIQQKKIVADLGDLDWKEARIMQYGAYNAFQEIKEQAVAMSLELDRRVAERCRQKQRKPPPLDKGARAAILQVKRVGYVVGLNSYCLS